MSLPIYVDAHSGYKANERPLRFSLDEETYDIASIEDRWQEPDAAYFKVRTTNSKTYLLRYEQQGDMWTLQRTEWHGGLYDAGDRKMPQLQANIDR